MTTSEQQALRFEDAARIYREWRAANVPIDVDQNASTVKGDAWTLRDRSGWYLATVTTDGQVCRKLSEQ